MRANPVGPVRQVWSGAGRDRGERKSECCARCRRGIKGYGELECGYDRACPNPKCLHAARPLFEADVFTGNYTDVRKDES